jgi:hypothetical protein
MVEVNGALLGILQGSKVDQIDNLRCIDEK